MNPSKKLPKPLHRIKRKRINKFRIPMPNHTLQPLIAELKILSRIREQKEVKCPEGNNDYLLPIPISKLKFGYILNKHIQKMNFRERFPDAYIP